MSPIEAMQPQIPAEYRQLKRGYPVGPLILDLFGTIDADGYQVLAVALTGTRIDLNAIASEDLLESATLWCNDKLPRCSTLLAASRYEAQIDRLEWERSA